GRADPAPHGPTRTHAGGHGAAARNAEPSERGPARQERAEHGNGTAVARALPRSSRPSHSAAQTSAAHGEAGGSLMSRCDTSPRKLVAAASNACEDRCVRSI